jgi:ribosomal protein S18 acetylase RimI-like enzyme
MYIQQLNDKTQIRQFLSTVRETHYYEIGDLDPFFWPYTTWYGWMDEDDNLLEIALIYDPGEAPILLSHSDHPAWSLPFLAALAPKLPDQIYAHLSPGGLEGLSKEFRGELHGLHDQMILRETNKALAADTSQTCRLTLDDMDDLYQLYDASYPGNWFTPRMMETGHFYGYREKGKLVSVAGIHVYSPENNVAALGNITTLPSARGQGLAIKTTARLCQELLEELSFIGLNVKSDNEKAIRTYQALGFEKVSEYDEIMLYRI